MAAGSSSFAFETQRLQRLWMLRDYDLHPDLVAMMKEVLQAHKSASDILFRAAFWSYVRDTWVIESAICSDAADMVMQQLDESPGDVKSLSQACAKAGTPSPAKQAQKLRNIYGTVCWLYGPDLQQHRLTQDWDLDFCQQVHRRLMNNLGVPSAFRTSDSAPSGSTKLYERPEHIGTRLLALMGFVRSQAAQLSSSQIGEWVLLGTLFFSEFLSIHPFSNGNGRTARLLVSHLLLPALPVPFPIRGCDRAEYIDALARRHQDTNNFHVRLAQLFCFSVRLHVANMRT